MTYISTETRQRIFIGIPLGDRTQKAIEQLLEPMQPCSRNLRWVPAVNRHLTLAFLGDISLDELENVQQGFAETYHEHDQFQYELTALERFPNTRGRIIALTGEAGEPLDNLAMATRDMLSECRLGFERKKFRPHITLARVRNPKHPVMRFDRRVNIGMSINRVALYRSTLTDSGSIYSVLRKAELR